MSHATHAEQSASRRSRSFSRPSALEALLDPFVGEHIRQATELQLAALARVINLLSANIRTLEESALQLALAAPDTGTFLVRLAEELAPTTPSSHPLYDAATRRGLELRNRILREDGGIVTAKEAATLLGLKTPQAIYGQVRERKLLAVPAGARGIWLPAWQFQDGKTLPGLRRVLQTLPESDPWWNLLFFVSTNLGLGNRRPLDALKAGDIEAVVRAAGTHGMGGR